ncbi:MAG: hypothetical protein LIP12_04850 [Clostridiales bacterium]|nr:hypothetical protein [Clostridiales bacterium]
MADNNKVKFNLKNAHYAKLTLDDDGVLVENSEVELESFSLLFEFDGDQKHIRHVLYNCSASRPKIEGQTNEDTKEVQTETLSIKATPLSDGMVKASAAIPRIYRLKFQRDIYKDLRNLEQAVGLEHPERCRV